MEGFKKEKIKLQKQYNKMHQFIEIKEIKGNVKQKEITDGYKESTKTKQLNYIQSELKEVQSRLRKNENDVAVFNELNGSGNVTILKGGESLKEELQKIVDNHEKLTKVEESLVSLRNGTIGKLSGDDLKSLADRMEWVADSLHSYELMDDDGKKEIIGQINGLHNANNSEEQKKQQGKKIVAQLLNYMRKSGKTSVSLKDTKEGRTKFEKLYNTIKHEIDGLKDTDLADKGLQSKRLLTYFDEFAEEKARLEWIKKEQEELQKKEGELKIETENLETDDAKLMDICRRLKVSESINKNYDVRRVVWLGAVLTEFLPKLQGEKDLDLKMKYISSPLFLELFTNIVAPLANEGNLKIALDISEPNGNNSKDDKDNKDDAGKICEFYQSLLNKNSNEDFLRKNIDNVLKNTVQLCVLIVLTKLNHHTNALSKDLDLISSLTLGSLDPIGLLKENFAKNNTDNEQKDILQDIVEKFFSSNQTTREAFDHIKNNNPMSKGIRGDHFNTGTTLFTTLNLIMRGLAIMADYKAHDGNDQNSMSKKALGFLGDSSIRRAKEEIARLGKDVHKEVAEKCIYEYLEMLRAGLNGRNYYPPQEPGDLPPTLLNVCHSQKFLKDYKKASRDSFPASLIVSPGIKRLDRVQAGVELGG